MVEYAIIKLKNLSPLHIGTGKENYDFSASQLHSDALSAALVAMKARHGENRKLREFLDSFTLSSAFPYVKDHYFLPRPLGKMNVSICDCDEYVSRKKLKALKYIELGLWKNLIAGKQVEVSMSQLKGGFLLAEKNSFKQPCKSVVHQRVSVPRVDNQDAEPFYFDWTFYDKEAGLFCITDAKGSLLDELIQNFEELGEYGIGTDKSVGGGKFSVEVEKISFDTIPDVNAKLLLSLYIPEEKEIQEIDLDNSVYELCLRGGYMAGSLENDFWHLRKKSIYMFNVGSILNTDASLVGKIVDLRPDYNDERMHPVYRSGKPFVVPIKM